MRRSTRSVRETDAYLCFRPSLPPRARGARFLNKEFFTFRPTWKIWLATNHKPEIKGTDSGIWSRPKLIPFTVTFEGREDRGLKNRLLDPRSLAGILRWAAEGAGEYLEAGLGYPDEVLQATAEYREESDILGRFVTECCKVGPSWSVPSRQLYRAFERWGGSMSETAFGKAMKEKFQAQRKSEGMRFFGLTLIDSTEDR
jgi:putative DNA primase/helicase